MNVGFQLFQLQSIDSEMDHAQNRIAEIVDAIQSDQVVAAARKKVENAELELRKIKSDFETIDYEIEQKKVKKSQSEANLYSGRIQNPKELQDIQAEIASLNKAVSDLEDQLLKQLMQMEDAEGKLADLDNTLKEALTNFETTKSRLIAEKDNLESAVKSLSAKRNSQQAQISADSLQVYEHLRQSKHGLAIAELQDSCCSACGSSLTASQCQQARSGSQLFTCPSCGRIVYGS
jgi:predicted  nucleic acid-binding Zn-ribbon protein